MNNTDAVPQELAELAAIRERLNAGDARFDALEAAQVRHTQELIANTAITSEIRDLMQAGRIARKVLGWLAGVATSVAVLWSSFHSTTPPK